MDGYVTDLDEMPELMGPLTEADQRIANGVVCGVITQDGEDIPWTEESWGEAVAERKRLGRPLSSDETWAIIRASKG